MRERRPPAAWFLDATEMLGTTPEDARVESLLALVARCVGATLVRLVVPGRGGLVTLASSRTPGDGTPVHGPIDAALVQQALATGLLARTAAGQLMPVGGAACEHLVLMAAPLMLSGAPRGVLECHGPSLGAAPDAIDALRGLCALVALAVDARDRTHAISLVAGGIAHDLNNHLTAINGLCEVVLEGDHLDAEVREDLACVSSAGAQALLLTQHLLAYSGRQILSQRVTSLDACVESTLPRIRHLVGNDISVRFVPCAERLNVDVDTQQVANVLLMLCANARDARASSIQLATDIVSADNGARFGRLTVTDDGTGMSEDVHARAFEPFFTTRRRLGHVGLGLPAAAGVLQQLGGAMAMASRQGQGTTVEVSLPLAASAPAPPPIEAQHHARVLVVDECDDVRHFVARALAADGHAVLEARSGPDALRVVSQDPTALDLLIADRRLPDESGPELVRAVTTARPGVQVLLTSACPDAEIRAAVGDEGQRWLSKPFTARAIREEVRDLLADR